jgi:large subunit ribosomal protein L9
MRVLLVKAVSGLGQKGAILEVSDGYARNFLLKKGLALPAESKNAQKTLDEIRVLEKRRTQKQEQIEELMGRLSSHKFHFLKPVTAEGALYAQVTPEEIASEIAKVFHLSEIQAKKVRLIAPIKHIGEHQAEFSHAGKKVIIKLEVSAQIKSD